MHRWGVRTHSLHSLNKYILSVHVMHKDHSKFCWNKILNGPYYRNVFCYFFVWSIWPICGSQVWFSLLLFLNTKLNVNFNFHHPTAGVCLTKGKNLSFSKQAFHPWQIHLNFDVFHSPLYPSNLWGTTDLIFEVLVARFLYNEFNILTALYFSDKT